VADANDDSNRRMLAGDLKRWVAARRLANLITARLPHTGGPAADPVEAAFGLMDFAASVQGPAGVRDGVRIESEQAAHESWARLHRRWAECRR